MSKLILGGLSLFIIAFLIFKAAYVFFGGLALLSLCAMIYTWKDNKFEALMFLAIIIGILVLIF